MDAGDVAPPGHHDNRAGCVARVVDAVEGAHQDREHGRAPRRPKERSAAAPLVDELGAHALPDEALHLGRGEAIEHAEDEVEGAEDVDRPLPRPREVVAPRPRTTRAWLGVAPSEPAKARISGLKGERWPTLAST